jgi:hypothetical protein
MPRRHGPTSSDAHDADVPCRRGLLLRLCPQACMPPEFAISYFSPRPRGRSPVVHSLWVLADTETARLRRHDGPDPGSFYRLCSVAVIFQPGGPYHPAELPEPSTFPLSECVSRKVEYGSAVVSAHYTTPSDYYFSCSPGTSTPSRIQSSSST